MTGGVRRGRAGRYAHYEKLFETLQAGAKKRPTYLHGIGLLKGYRGTTVWLRIVMRRGGLYRGKTFALGQPLEIKLGNKAQWSWEDLDRERSRLQALADRGEPLEAVQTATVAQYATDWLARKKLTVRGYGTLSSNVAAHLIPAFGDKALSELSRADINNWQARQLETSKHDTVRRILATLKAILNDAVQQGLIVKSPAAFLDRLEKPYCRSRRLSGVEVDAILDAADRIEKQRELSTGWPHEVRGWLRNFVLWAVHSGMRRGEILALRFRDIETEGGYTRAVVRQSKSGEARIVSCNKTMCAIIQQMSEVNRAKDDDRLFPVSLSTVKRALSALWQTCGVADVRLHDLRRTHASRLIDRGIDVVAVADRLGHADLKMLQKHYARMVDDQKAAAAAQELFSGVI